MTFAVSGALSSALTHFAQLGLGHILQGHGAEDVRIFWQDGLAASALVSWTGTVSAEAAVHAHVCHHSGEDSWVQASIQHAGRETGLLSPRIKAPSSDEEWVVLESAREVQIDGVGGPEDILDHRMIGALGEPAHWLCSPTDNQPDQGASRWEMKTRNRGEEFVGNRLAPLARALAARSLEDLRRGLAGELVQDELGGGAASRTATGFAVPGPTDSALAWCALWGIAATRLVPRSRAMSQTSGCAPRGRVHPTRVALPVTITPIGLGFWRSIAASAAFDSVAFGGDYDPLLEASRSWLKDRNVAGLVEFPVRKAGSQSAPERQILAGVFRPLAQ